MYERYRVIKGSVTSHCYFEATVVDTEKKAISHPEWICECFDVARAHAIADAMNMADEAPLSEKTPEPALLDRFGKEFDLRSALLYFPGGRKEPLVVLPCEYEIDTLTGRWDLLVNSIPDWDQYGLQGSMGKKHSLLLKLEASIDDFNNG